MLKQPIIQLNGISYEYKKSLSIYELLNYLGFNLNVVLVDYNGNVIPKPRWSTIQLQDQDKIEILTLAGGG